MYNFSEKVSNEKNALMVVGFFSYCHQRLAKRFCRLRKKNYKIKSGKN